MHRFLVSEKKRILYILQVLMLIASVLIILIISLEAFSRDGFVGYDGLYMDAQLPICIVFLAYFGLHMYYSPDPPRFFRRHIIYFLLSIPYSWIITKAGVHLHGIGGYAIHLIPLMRAVLALVIIVNYISSNKLIGIFASYTLILVLSVYFCSVLFYICERHINPAVTSYWVAFWWTWLQASTLGASFYPVSIVGKIIAGVMSIEGMLMFPLFTVYLTQMIKKYVGQPSANTENNS